MGIIGLGMDIIDIIRIANLVEKFGDKLAKRILCDQELLHYQSSRYPVRFLAKRFVAKEAAVKAFGTGMSNGITYKHFSIYNDRYGKPYLKYKNILTCLVAKDFEIKSIHLSITDEKFYACATVIIES
ncbi:MAG: holo-ACP synthase [Candidatus Dasytiphilus stammeri]